MDPTRAFLTDEWIMVFLEPIIGGQDAGVVISRRDGNQTASKAYHIHLLLWLASPPSLADLTLEGRHYLPQRAGIY